MKSIKPGRGPSQQSMIGSIVAAIFGVFWCCAAASMGAGFMVPFGLIFIGIAIYNAVYSHHNLTSENRYSIVDIVDDEEESDPFNEKYGHHRMKEQWNGQDDEETEQVRQSGTSVSFCPYCGNSVDSKFDFCPKCGKKLPD